MFNFSKKSPFLSSFLIFSYLFIGCGGDSTHNTTKSIPKPQPQHKNPEDQKVDKLGDKAADKDTPKLEPVIVQKPLPINTTGITINEILTANANTNLDPDFKQFSDWIELHNSKNQPVNISGFYLSDDETNPTKYKIPSGTTIASHGYLLIWADEKDSKKSNLHANFKLSQKGEYLTLADKKGNIIDLLEFGRQDGDVSCVRVDDSIVYMKPTPKAINSQTYDKSKRSKKPKFSHASGFYNGFQSIELTQENGGVIYYTLDGSIPTKNSMLYTKPISISKTTAIRTRAYEDEKLLSNVKNQTFLIDEDISLPVVSLTIDDKYMYGDKGIYTNYEKDWMRPAGIEYIKDGKSQFSENVGVRISGAGSRKKAQKSLSIFVKNKYGPKSLKYPLFADKPNIKKIKSFLLRTSGGDVRLLMRDALTHELVRGQMDIDYQSYHAVVAFINGKYHGVLNIREKLNEDYIKANHGVDEVDMIGERGELLKGSDKAYKSLISFVKNNDLSNMKNYDKVIKQIDLDEYINYNITEIFVANWDWPVKNIKYWKEHAVNGKWRWMLYDTDDGYGAMRVFSDNTFKFLLEEEYVYNSKEAKYLLRGLFSNRTFVDRFVDKFTTHLNLTFKQSRVDSFVKKLKSSLVPEIDRHFARWIPYEPRLQQYDYSVAKWHDKIDNFTKTDDGHSRAEHLREHMRNYFGRTGSNFLQINIPSHGTVSIDGVKLVDDYRGEYFNKAKVTLKAIPSAGHSFVKWSDGNRNLEITVALDSDVSISAEFH